MHGGSVKGSGGERQKRLPGFPFLPPVSSGRGGLRKPGSVLLSSKIFRVGGEVDFDGFEPEAAKREPTLGGCGIRRRGGRVKGGDH